MKVREWWIYQSRKVPEPWALHITARKEYRRIRADCEIYADWFFSPSKRFLIQDVSIVQSSNLIELIAKICKRHGHDITNDDERQIRQELRDLKASFNQ